MKRTTIKDVAALADVSPATVSRVFSGEASVAANIAERVRTAADTLNYRPSMMARSLTVSRTNLVALVVGRLHNPFDAHLVEALSQGLQRFGRRLLVVPADYGENDPGAMVALDYQVDGVIVAAGHLSKDSADRFVQLGVPVVLYGRTLDAPGVDSIIADNHPASRTIGELFRRSGVERALYVRHVRTTFSDDEREKGFRDGLGDGIAFDVLECTKATARELALAALASRNRPQAAFCANDVLAFGVMEAAVQLGLDMPEDFMVAGFDDIDMASSPFFNLTTLHQSPVEIADWIVARLDERLSNPKADVTTHRVRAPLKLRGTTRNLRYIGGLAAARATPEDTR
jgi:DNA-binding LacI/PurR family transcriptional regulator